MTHYYCITAKVQHNHENGKYEAMFREGAVDGGENCTNPFIDDEAEEWTERSWKQEKDRSKKRKATPKQKIVYGQVYVLLKHVPGCKKLKQWTPISTEEK
jgi:hypothetical protein